MNITLLGAGTGVPESLTLTAQNVLLDADAILGAARLQSALPKGTRAEYAAATDPDEILAWIDAHPTVHTLCILLSGDPGFYSGARRLLPRLSAHTTTVLPGISSVQALAARLGRPWQNWKLASAHGRDCQAALLVRDHAETFFLTGGAQALCQTLCEAGFSALTGIVGERLGGADERLVSGTLASLAAQPFDPLSVLLVENPNPRKRRTPGFPDSAFCRGDVPMTKSEVRAAILAKLALEQDDVVFDVGAGTGSVAVEAALCVRSGQVYAIEREADACALIAENAVRFGAHNLTIVPGVAPDVLDALPAPDAAFLGGTGGTLLEILAVLLAKNPALRLVVSAVTLETLSAVTQAFATLPIREVEINQIAVTRAKEMGKHHLLCAQNPIFLVSGVGAND